MTGPRASTATALVAEYARGAALELASRTADLCAATANALDGGEALDAGTLPLLGSMVRASRELTCRTTGDTRVGALLPGRVTHARNGPASSGLLWLVHDALRRDARRLAD